MISEKSLFEIWSKSLPKLAPNRANLFFNFSGIIFFIVPIIFGKIENFSTNIFELSSSFAQIYAGLIGFVIAGYTIFSTSTNPDFMKRLYNFKSEQNSNLPLLKVHLLVFVRMFIYLLINLTSSLLIMLFFKLYPVLAKSIIFRNDQLIIIGQSIICGILGFAISSTITQLKILIFNLYNLCLTQVAASTTINES